MKKFILGLLFGFILVISLGFGHLKVAASPTSVYVDRGVRAYTARDYLKAIDLWKKALEGERNTPEENAIIRKNLARAYEDIGQYGKAIDHWRGASDIYRQLGRGGELARTLTEQAGAHLHIGQTRRAIDLLYGREGDNPAPDSAVGIARKSGDRTAEIAAKGRLGDAYRVLGDRDRSIAILEPLAKIEDTPYRAAILIGLGNAHLARGQYWQMRADSARKSGVVRERDFNNRAVADYFRARDYFRDSLKDGDRLEPRLQLLRLNGEMGIDFLSPEEVKVNLDAARRLWEKLPDSSEKVYRAIDIITLRADNLAACYRDEMIDRPTRQLLLNRAINIADSINDNRALSFALGVAGHDSECAGELDRALELTRKAVINAGGNINDRDSLYLWEWQTGRILESRNRLPAAINSYTNAVDSLEKIRADLLASDRDLQLDFRASVEPVYRRLAKLKIDTLDTLPVDRQQRQIGEALETIDSLRSAELQNYLGSNCFLRANPRPNDDIQENLPKNTAVFSSMLFDDETAIIVRFPDGSKKVSRLPLDRATVTARVNRFRQGLIDGRLAIDDYDTTTAKILHDWFILPFVGELERNKITNLVFIQDSIFRSIPMSALYDGKKFLIEKYSVSINPSLKLTDLSENNTRKDRVLILGVTEEVSIDDQNFEALVNVPKEIKTLQTRFRDHLTLVDNKFTVDNLQRELTASPYQILHVATHARFGTIPEETFLVAGNRGKLTIDRLESFLRGSEKAVESLELLSLTACQTAEGDDRSALGLAGVAVQAGVKSVLASLWSIPDESTLNLVDEFYGQLVEKGTSKAEALRLAQLKLINAKENPEINDQYDNPAYWAAFILIGNWN